MSSSCLNIIVTLLIIVTPGFGKIQSFVRVASVVVASGCTHASISKLEIVMDWPTGISINTDMDSTVKSAFPGMVIRRTPPPLIAWV